MSEDEIRDLFREMREEPIPAGSLARVRMRVAARASRRRWWKIIVPAAAVAGCVLAGFLLLKPAKAPVQIQAPSLPETAHVQPAPPDIPVRTVARPKRARPKQMAAVPVSIRIETPDPEVVILLVN